MRRHHPRASRSRRAALAALALALALHGCGSEDDEGSAPRPRPTETADELPKLPRGWEQHLNPRGGLTLGVPPDWRAENRGTSVLLRSADRLVAISITPDRTGEALELPLGEFATRTAAALPGFRRGLDPGRSRDFAHRYPAASVSARGRAKRTGVEQRVTVVVIRRPRLATFTAVIAANVEPEADASRKLAVAALRTLRGRPIG